MSEAGNALVERFPRLAALQPRQSVLIRDETGRPIDLDLGAGRLYNGDAGALAAEQVERFNARPLQFFTADLSGTNIGSPVSARLRDRLLAGLRELDITTLSNKPEYEGTFLVILGIGLGQHLKPLFETTKARHILLCEPMAEFLAHARDTVDWNALFDIAETRGITIGLSQGATPGEITSDIRNLIKLVGEPFIDGAYVFVHYPSWVLTETRDQLQAVVDQIFISKGFFEDELLMMGNATGNAKTYAHRVIDARPKLARKETVIITGSGPSIDRSMPDLKRLAPDAVVFSSGTSIRICLRNGIRPDYHCELENGAITYDVLKKISEDFDLSGITLIASLTVDPRVASLFDKVIFFFRDEVSSSRMLAPPRHIMTGTAPTCVNTSLRTAAALGFVNFILFGTDCGSKIEDSKHSRDSVYNDEAFFQDHDKRTIYGQTLPGNFGGIVSTNWVLALCASMIGDVATAYQLNVQNTADGARLRNTQPRLSNTIRAINKVTDRARLHQDIDRITKAYRPGELLEAWSGGQLRAEAERFFDDLQTLVDAAIAEGDDLVGFWRRLSPFLKGLDGQYAETFSISIGSIRSMPKIGMYFVHRVTAPEKRAKLVTIFMEEYREIVAFMREGTLNLLSRLSEGYPENAQGIEA